MKAYLIPWKDRFLIRRSVPGSTSRVVKINPIRYWYYRHLQYFFCKWQNKLYELYYLKGKKLGRNK